MKSYTNEKVDCSIVGSSKIICTSGALPINLIAKEQYISALFKGFHYLKT